MPFRHNEFGEIRSLLWAIGESNIRLRGDGEIDFNHPAFMHMDTPDTRGPDGEKIVALSPEQQEQTTVMAKARPTQPMFFHDCERLKVDDLKLRRSPCWTMTLSASRDIRVRGITVDNHLRVPNCDGMHITSSRDVVVANCVFRCADDCVAITGITDWDRPSENIVVTGCTMVSRSCAVRIGNYASKVRNVILSDLILSDGNRGVGIFAGNNGWIENIRVHDVILHTRVFAGFWWGKGEPLAVVAVEEGNGRIDGVHMSRVSGTCEGGIVLAGREGSVRNVTLTDWNWTLRSGANRPPLGQWIDLQPDPCRPLTEGHVPWVYADGVENVRLERVTPGRDREDRSGFSMEPIIESGNVRLDAADRQP